MFPKEGGSGLPQSSGTSQVSLYVRDFVNWAWAGRGPRCCSVPEQFPTTSVKFCQGSNGCHRTLPESVSGAGLAFLKERHAGVGWGGGGDAPSMATAQSSGDKLAHTHSISPATLGPGSTQWGDFVPGWDGTRPSLRKYLQF